MGCLRTEPCSITLLSLNVVTAGDYCVYGCHLIGIAAALIQASHLGTPLCVTHVCVSCFQGSINLETGEFTENEIFDNGVFRPATPFQIKKYQGHQLFLDTALTYSFTVRDQ
jgi:hypothetical protein